MRTPFFIDSLSGVLGSQKLVSALGLSLLQEVEKERDVMLVGRAHLLVDRAITSSPKFLVNYQCLSF